MVGGADEPPKGKIYVPGKGGFIYKLGLYLFSSPATTSCVENMLLHRFVLGWIIRMELTS